MSCTVLKVFNNNVVLASEQERQLVLISKGIGFGKKSGDQIDLSAIDEDKRIFHFLESAKHESELRRLSQNIEDIERVTRDTVAIAAERLAVVDTEDRLFEALFDHITFSIERLKVGVPIENPFVAEIGVLCREEWPVAQATAAMVRERLAVELSDSEIGFIALHLYSARRQNSVGVAMKNVRIYSEILDILGACYHREFQRTTSEVTLFLTLLSGYIIRAREGAPPLSLPLKNQLQIQLPEAFYAAEQVAKLLSGALFVQLDADELAFLALDIYRLAGAQ